MTEFRGLTERAVGEPPVMQIRPWYPLAQQTGLTALTDLYWDGVDHSYIEALVERWNPLKNAFEFPLGDITITLHDVLCLFGLPIEGHACVLPVDAPVLDRVTVAGMFGWDAAVAAGAVTSVATRKPMMLARVTEWMGAGEEVEEQRRPLIASAMLAQLLTGTLFIDKSGTDIRHEVLAMVLDLERVGTYTWGAGLLALVYRSVHLILPVFIYVRRVKYSVG